MKYTKVDKMQEPDVEPGAPPPEPPPPSSRLCVKNLPKHINEAGLREHFSRFGDITDAKVLRTVDGHSRQMAFLGFKTVQQAVDTLKYFDRTFMGASRLQVEFAARVGDSALPRPWSKYSKGSSANQVKRKVDEPQEEEPPEQKKKTKKKKAEAGLEGENPKLAEFLELMQPRAKARAWANDNLDAVGKKPWTEAAAQQARGKKEQSTAAQGGLSDDEDGEEDMLYQDLATKDEDQAPEVDEAAPKDQVVVDNAVSDLDYLKARMRTLDSDDEEEEEEDVDAKAGASGSEEEGGDGEDGEDEEEDDDNEPDSPRNNAKLRGDQSGVGSRHRSDVTGADEVQHQDGGKDGKPQPTVVEGEKSIAETGRLFVRNLPYAATEAELMELFQQYGQLEEVHLVLDKNTKRSKGFAYVSFVKSDDAVSAASELDCSIFQGRLLHILPAQRPPQRDIPQGPAAAEEEEGQKGGSFKAERDAKRKAEAGSRSAWNTLFMRQDTVAEAIAAYYGVAKSQLLDRDAGDLAVRMALGEAHVISQTKEYMAEAGVDVGKLEAAAAASGKAAATKSVSRSDSTLLVKNLPYSSTEEDLEEMFSKCGSVARIVLPPTRTLALVEFLEPQDARKAFKALAYKKYQHVPLYLEWAPKDIFTVPASVAAVATAGPPKKKQKQAAAEKQDAAAAVLPSAGGDADDDDAHACSLYVKNLAFSTTAARLRSHFDKAVSALGGRLVSCKLMMRKGPDGKDLSRGFGFVEVDTEDIARAVMKELQGSTLDGHQLSLQLSRRKASAGPGDESGATNTKKAKGDKVESTTLVVRNLAFEATNKDVLGLFSPFGHIKACRLPKKFDGTIRGFAFVEFVTKQEAKQAMEGVAGTHLYGRRLVVEYAKEESSLDDLRAKTAAKFKGE